jgi:hypothetical protein
MSEVKTEQFSTHRSRGQVQTGDLLLDCHPGARIFNLNCGAISLVQEWVEVDTALQSVSSRQSSDAIRRGDDHWRRLAHQSCISQG